MELIKGKIIRPQKVVIYGPEGIGKSTFAAQFPDPVFIDTEGSTAHLDVTRTPSPSSWQMVMDQVKYLIKNPSVCKTLIIDTADWAELLCISHICAKSQKSGIEDFGYGKGYTYLSEEYGRLLNLLEEAIDAGMHVVLTAHAKMRKFEQPDEMGSYDRWEMKVSKNVAPLIREWADMVLFANYETVVIKSKNEMEKNKVQGGKRVVYTAHHPCWDAKNRHNLPEKVNFEFASIAHCIISVNEAPHTTKPAEAPPTSTAPAPAKSDVPPAGFTELPADTTVPFEADTAQTKPDVPTLHENIPKALSDLMTASNILPEEVQQVVAARGYYPKDTPIDKYDSTFIDGVLIGAWPQVCAMVEALPDRLPF